MRVGVIGGGLMGSGIAEVCARSGVDVTVVEVDEARAEGARAAIEKSLARGVRSGKLSEADREAALEHLVVTPKFEDIEGADAAIEAVIEDEGLKRDVFRSGGPGGQHQTKTESGARYTHLPTGVAAESRSERSQHKNRSRAMSLLKARLLASEREKQQSQQAQSRKLQVGSGDRSERIRTYNFPQGRVTDHRINLTLYKLDDVMHGNLDELIGALNQEHQAEELAQQVE